MKNMKYILGLLLLTAVFTACTDEDAPVVPVEYEVISFEKAEGMLDAAEMPVELGSVTIVGFVGGTFNKVLCAKDYMMEEDFNGSYFDDLFFKTTDGKIGFGSYFTDFKFDSYGAYDTWGGFSLSQNFSKVMTDNGMPDYANCSFSAWATKGANATDTFALAYYNGYGVYDYHTPKIIFAEPRTVGYFYMANATLTAQYKSPKEGYFFKVIATGYVNGTEGRKVEQTLISGTSIVSDWVKVDCTSLGEIDEIRFTIDTNDKSSNFPNCPSYFCIDEIGVVKIDK